MLYISIHKAMYIHIIRCYSIYIESENHSFLMYRMKISIIVIVIVHCITFEKMESLSKACFGAFKKSRGRLLCLSVYVKPTFCVSCNSALPSKRDACNHKSSCNTIRLSTIFLWKTLK